MNVMGSSMIKNKLDNWYAQRTGEAGPFAPYDSVASLEPQAERLALVTTRTEALWRAGDTAIGRVLMVPPDMLNCGEPGHLSIDLADDSFSLISYYVNYD